MIFIADVVLPLMVAGVKVAVTLDGKPEADREMLVDTGDAVAEIVVVFELPRETVRALGVALIEITGAGAVTVSAIVAVCVTPPPVPVTVMV